MSIPTSIHQQLFALQTLQVPRNLADVPTYRWHVTTCLDTIETLERDPEDLISRDVIQINLGRESFLQGLEVSGEGVPLDLNKFYLSLRFLLSGYFSTLNEQPDDLQTQAVSKLINVDFSKMNKQLVDLYGRVILKHTELFHAQEDHRVKLSIGDLEPLQLPKNFLIARSKVFETTLDSGMLEAKAREVTIDVGDGDSAHAVSLLCKNFITIGEYQESEDVLTLIRCANHYMLNDLLMYCSQTLLDTLSMENVELIFSEALILSYAPLIVGCLDFIQEHREEWEGGKDARDPRSEHAILMDNVALLPRAAFNFSASSEGALQLSLSDCQLFRSEHLIDALKLLSRSISVPEIKLCQGEVGDVERILEIFPECCSLDISLLHPEGHTIPPSDLLNLGCEQIRELVIMLPKLFNDVFDAILRAFPNLKGFGNTSPLRITQVETMTDYLDWFAPPDESTVTHEKPRLRALNFRCERLLSHPLNDHQSMEQNVLDVIEPYFSELYHLGITNLQAVKSVVALRARTLTMINCRTLQEVIAPNVKKVSCDGNLCRNMFFPRAEEVRCGVSQKLTILVATVAKKIICERSRKLTILVAPQVEVLDCEQTSLREISFPKAEVVKIGDNKDLSVVDLPRVYDFKALNIPSVQEVNLPTAHKIIWLCGTRNRVLKAPNARMITTDGSLPNYYSSLTAPVAFIKAEDPLANYIGSLMAHAFPIKADRGLYPDGTQERIYKFPIPKKL